MIVLRLLFCLILDFENSENKIKDDIGDKKHSYVKWISGKKFIIL